MSMYFISIAVRSQFLGEIGVSPVYIFDKGKKIKKRVTKYKNVLLLRANNNLYGKKPALVTKNIELKGAFKNETKNIF